MLLSCVLSVVDICVVVALLRWFGLWLVLLGRCGGGVVVGCVCVMCAYVGNWV